MAGFTFAGMDPTKSITGNQALTNLQGTLGRNLTADERTRAMGLAGYGDFTGAGTMTGTQYNRILEEAAKLTGGTYTPWAAPGGSTTTGNFSGSTSRRVNMPTIAPAPALNLPQYERPEAFSFTGQNLYSDPSYQFVRDQGAQALERGAAARGMLRTGNTLRDMVDYNQQAASREFQNAYGRAADTYDRNVQGGRYAHEQGTNRAAAEYVPRLTSWQRDADMRQRAAELEFDREWQADLFSRDDDWRRFQYTNEDAWRRFQLEEQRRQFLASLGNQ
jgi:hypothetical protein